MITPKQRTLLFSAVALTSVCAGAIPAQADSVLTFVRETTGSLTPQRQQRFDGNSDAGVDPPQAATVQSAPKQNVIVQIKGTFARVEFRPLGAKPDTTPTTVVLYDGMGQKVYTLDSATKSYYVQSYKEAIDGERRASTTTSGGTGSRVTFKGTTDLKAARENNAFVTKEIMGTRSRRYLVSGTAEMQLNLPQGRTVVSPQNGRFPGGITGGAPGDWRTRRQGGQGGPGSGFTPPSLGIEGEIWSTDATSLFTAGRDTPIVAIYRLMIPDNVATIGGTLTKPLMTRLKNMKSLPGESIVSFRMIPAFRDTGNGAPPSTDTPLTTRLLIKERNTGTTLEDALFTVPTDFKESKPPTLDEGLNRPGPEGGRAPVGGGRRFGGNQENE